MNFFDGQIYRRKGVSLRGSSGKQVRNESYKVNC